MKIDKNQSNCQYLNDKISYLIVNDEESTIQTLKLALSVFDEFIYINSFGNPHQAIDYLQKYKVDLIFWEGKTKSPNYEAEYLWVQKVPSDTEIVLITDDLNYLNNASVSDYNNRIIVFFNKPVLENHIRALIFKFRYLKNKEKTELAIVERNSTEDLNYLLAYKENDSSKQLTKILHKDIVYIESKEGRKISIFTTETPTPYQISISLNKIADKLPSDGQFLKIRRNYIISTKNMSMQTNFMVSKYTSTMIRIPRRIWELLKSIK